ncbi:Hypothetical protein CAP_4403 [Chondromyces apiculatus DSM 436]|uniref:Uncharacterized protein n=1 Tax=Chondromyces apiculatus DSM 436 TaxID=1192034 RepID=A0A017T5Q6_9BACT|nr:Hypothetical protein CAP_4403 [Chondromyces apiculatus DSM 436]
MLAEERSLPQGVVGVLHGERRPRRGLTPAARGVRGGEVARQRSHGPAVADDVVHQHEEHVDVWSQREQRGAQGRLGGQVEAVTHGGRQGFAQPRLVDVGDGQRGPRRGGVEDHLVRRAFHLREDGPQALVAGHDVAKGRLERLPVQRSGQAQRQGQVVGRRAALHLVQEPQAPLRERQGQPLRARLHGQRKPRLLRAVELGRQPGHGRRLEQAAQGQLGAEGGPDPAHQPRGEQRVPAQREEVLVDAHLGEGQHLGEQIAQDLLLGRSRPPLRALQAEIRCGQRVAIELAVGSEGQALQDHHRRGDHVLGQALAQVVAQRLRPRGAVREGDGVGHEPLPASVVLASDDCGLRELGVRGQRGLDLAELDAEAPDLHLGVEAPEELQRAVLAPAGMVAGAVHARAGWAERVGDEALRRQAWAVQVPPGEAGASDVQLAGNARGRQVQAPVEHVHLRVVDRLADGHRQRARREIGGQGAAGSDVGLGRAVVVVQATTGLHPVQLAHLTAQRQRFTRLGDVAQGRQGQPLLHRSFGERLHHQVRREQLLHLVLGEPAGQVLRAPAHAVGGHHQGLAEAKRGQDLLRRHVEAQGGELRDARACTARQGALVPEQEVHQGATGHHHALGNPRRAGGVDHVRRVLRHQQGRALGVGRGGGGEALQRRSGGGVVHHQPGRGHVVGNGRLCRPARQQHRGPGILQHRRDARGRVVRIHRDVGRARLQRRQERHDQVRGARQEQGDASLRASAPRDQRVRQPVRPGVDLGIGQRGVVEHHRCPFRQGQGLRLEQGWQADLGQCAGGVVVVAEQRLALLGGEQVDPAERQLGIGHRRLQQAQPPGHHRLDRGGVEQIARVLEHALDALATAVCAAPLAQREEQIELGGLQRHGHGGCGDPRQVEVGFRVVLQHQHDLEQRVVRQGADGVQDLDQELEGHVLMRVGPERRLARPTQQLREAGVPRGVGAQHQGVHEEADEVVEGMVGAASDGAPEDDVLARAEPRQERGQAGLEHHEEAGAALTGQLEQAPVQGRPQADGHGAAAGGGHQGAWTIGGQRKLLRHPGEGSGPVGDLGGEQAARIALVSEQPELPQGVVGVLHRQRRPARGAELAAGLVRGGQIVEQRAHRPAIAGDVMEQEEQDVLVGAEGKDLGAERGLDREIEAAPRRLGQQGWQGGGARRGDSQPRVGSGQVEDALVRHLVDHGEHGAQALVAAHHVCERGRERRHVEFAAQVERQRDVVGGAGAVHGLEEPEATLRERERQEIGTLGARQRQPRASGGVEARRQAGHRGRFEERAQRQLHAERGAEARDDLGGEQRVPAQREEVVLRAHPANPEQTAPDLGHHLLGPGAGRDEAGGVVGVGLRQRQGPAIELAVRRERQGLQHDERGGDHVLRQRRRQMDTQHLRRGPLPSRDHVRHEPLVPGDVLARDDRAGAHRGVQAEHRLDLAKLDAEAAQLHLVVDAAEELEVAVGQPPHEVSGAVEAGGRRAEGIGHEARLRQLRPVQVAVRETGAAKVQLSGDADGNGRAARIQHVHPGVRDRLADGRDIVPCRRDQARGRHHGALRRTVVVHQREGQIRRRTSAQGISPREQRSEVHALRP